MARTGDTPDEWVLQFELWLEEHITNWDLSSLYDYAALAPYGQTAVQPYGEEHFVPLFYTMGAADNQRFRYGSLTHSVWQFGQ